MSTQRTYKQAKSDLWDLLDYGKGWNMSSPLLKTPHATEHNSTRRCVWFKPQTIFVGFTGRLGDARTVTYEDIRVFSADELYTLIMAF